METIFRENMSLTDFVEFQVLSMNLPNKNFCVVDRLLEKTDLHYYTNGDCYFTVSEDRELLQEDITSISKMVLYILKRSGSPENVRPEFDRFIKMISKVL
jgi:hypothetical protein